MKPIPSWLLREVARYMHSGDPLCGDGLVKDPADCEATDVADMALELLALRRAAGLLARGAAMNDFRCIPGTKAAWEAVDALLPEEPK